MDGASKDRIVQLAWAALAWRLDAHTRGEEGTDAAADDALVSASMALTPGDVGALHERLFGTEREAVG